MTFPTNPAAVLGLLSDMYTQAAQLSGQIDRLAAENAELRATLATLTAPPPASGQGGTEPSPSSPPAAPQPSHPGAARQPERPGFPA